MENNVESVSKMLAELKSNKRSPSMIEGHLEFSNGLLGKAAKGITTLSDNKFTMLREYYIEHYVPLTKIEIPEKKFDGSKINYLKADETLQFQTPIDIEEIDFVILKDGMKRRITKDVVLLLMEKYCPNTTISSSGEQSIPEYDNPHKEPLMDYNYFRFQIDSTNDTKILYKLHRQANMALKNANEYKEILKIATDKINLIQGDSVEKYKDEIEDNKDFPDFLKNDIAPRIRESHLNPIQKRDLLASFGAK